MEISFGHPEVGDITVVKARTNDAARNVNCDVMW